MLKIYDKKTGMTRYELEDGEVCPPYPFKKNNDFRKAGLYPMHLTLDEFTITEDNKKRFLACNQDLYQDGTFIPYLNDVPLITFVRETIKDYPILHYKLHIANNELHLEMFVYFAENYLRDRIQFYAIDNELPEPIAKEHAFQDIRDYYHTLNNYNPVSEFDHQYNFLKGMVNSHIKKHELIPDDTLTGEDLEMYNLLYTFASEDQDDEE